MTILPGTTIVIDDPTSIYNECKIVINLNSLVKARPCGVDLADEHVDNIANDLRKRMTFDSLFGQVDTAIW